MLGEGINRIRLEFKACYQSHIDNGDMVLIESDWNLKLKKAFNKTAPKIVLIESDWNLKEELELTETKVFVVLIESDWNLKPEEPPEPPPESPY